VHLSPELAQVFICCHRAPLRGKQRVAVARGAAGYSGAPRTYDACLKIEAVPAQPRAGRAGYASDRRNRLAEAWDELAGAPGLHAAALPPGGLCADAAVLGANAAGLDVVPLDAYATDADAGALAPGLRAFRAWALARLRLPPGAPWAARRRARGRLALTLVDRGAAAKRRLVDQGTVAAAARARGFVVSIVDFERMALREQLDVLRATDVLLGVHGGALPLVLFLPRGAVRAAAGACMLALECRFDCSIMTDCSFNAFTCVGLCSSLGLCGSWRVGMAADSHARAGRQVGVEVQPFKQHAGATHDFTFGYCNWARAAGAQHLVWHARSASQARLLPVACWQCTDRPHPAWRAVWPRPLFLLETIVHMSMQTVCHRGEQQRAPGAMSRAPVVVAGSQTPHTSCAGTRGLLAAVQAVHARARRGSAWGRLPSASSAHRSRPLRVRQGRSGAAGRAGRL